MNNHNERVIIMNKEEQDMELILKVYHEEEEKRKKLTKLKILELNHLQFDIWKSLKMINHLLLHQRMK